MTVDEFATALGRLIAEAMEGGLNVDQLVDVLDRQSDAISGVAGRVKPFVEPGRPPEGEPFG